MDDARYTDNLDVAAIRARDDILVILRLMRVRADNPSVRTGDARTRHSTVPVSKTVVSQMHAPGDPPSAAARTGTSQLQHQVKQQMAENEQLRLQLSEKPDGPPLLVTFSANHRSKRMDPCGIHLFPLPATTEKNQDRHLHRPF
jgi:hypothetical protein